jgi:hypothetical protein
MPEQTADLKMSIFRLFNEEDDMVYQGRNTCVRNAALTAHFGYIPYPSLCDVRIQKNGRVQVWSRDDEVSPMRFSARFRIEKETPKRKKRKGLTGKEYSMYKVFPNKHTEGDPPIYEGKHENEENAFWIAALGYIPKQTSPYSIQFDNAEKGVMSLCRYMRKTRTLVVEKTLVVIKSRP